MTLAALQPCQWEMSNDCEKLFEKLLLFLKDKINTTTIPLAYSCTPWIEGHRA